jgi:flagellar motility protein MotE (MotC chaperone)
VETVVDQLLEIDRKARQSIDEAQHYYENTMKEIEVERRRIAGDYMQSFEGHIAKVRQTEDAAQAEEIAGIQERFSVLERQLDDAYEQSHGTWEGEIFRRITGKGAE